METLSPSTNGHKPGRPAKTEAEREAERLERERMKDPAYVTDLLDKATADVARLTREAKRAQTEALDAKRTALDKARTRDEKKAALIAAEAERSRLQAALWDAEDGSVQ